MAGLGIDLDGERTFWLRGGGIVALEQTGPRGRVPGLFRTPLNADLRFWVN